MGDKAVTAAVFTVSLLLIGWNAAAPGLATAYVDPVGKIVAQDEAVYASTSLNMAEYGDWMTPRFLGRLALYKPPMLYWLSAASVKALGRGRFAIRLPSIVAGAATLTLVFLILRAIVPISGALTGVLLLLSSHLFFVISRVGLTDALLMFEITTAMYSLARDPRLQSRRWLWIFGIASGLAIMTKATAGLFPLLILAGFCVISKERPGVGRLLHVVAITAAVALPWHIWQLVLHPRWFWNEYIMTEQLGWGLAAKSQSTQESPSGFYLKRLLLLDPILLIGGLIAIARRISEPRERVTEPRERVTEPRASASGTETFSSNLFKSAHRLMLVWIAIVLLGCAAFQYRNTSYLLPVYPALSVLVACAIPARYSRVAFAAAAMLFIGKALIPGTPLGIPFAAESVNPSHAMLDSYRSMHRGNTLIIVEPDDQFYSADLDLPHVRYVYVDPRIDAETARTRRDPLDFRWLGVTVTADEFARLPELRPAFAQRLREFNLDSGEAVATVILARDKDAVSTIIASHPEDDFFIPKSLGRREFLLSSKEIQRP